MCSFINHLRLSAFSASWGFGYLALTWLGSAGCGSELGTYDPSVSLSTVETEIRGPSGKITIDDISTASNLQSTTGVAGTVGVLQAWNLYGR